MPPRRMHGLSLGFDDAELERAYLRSRSFRWRTFTLAMGVTVLNWTAFGAWASVVAPSDARLVWGGLVHYALPLLALGFVVTRLTPERHRERAVALSNLTLPLLLTLPLIRWHVEGGEPLTRYMAPFFALYLAGMHTFLNASFMQRIALTWAAVFLWGMAMLVLVPLRLERLVDDAYWILLAQGTGSFLGYLTDRQRRRIFLQRREIEEERAKSERLLRNMLPAAVAERLKREPGVIADSFDAVTVLFADIVGFTPLSEGMTPHAVVKLLNEVFSAFDEIARRHGLEKIKTIGDAYMVVGGVPEARADHAAAVAAMALEMRATVARIAGGGLALRIGLHTGPVVAGVIGTSKYSYDLWGDTVNTASRMEAHGAPGAIHVSERCRAQLGDAFELEERGVVDIKGKGPMRTWWLKGFRGDHGSSCS